MTTISWRTAVLAVGIGLVARDARAQTPAPIGRGSWIVSGTAGWTHAKTEDHAASTSVSLSPSVLYFVRSQLALGGSLNGSYSRAGSAETTSLGIGPEIRYYPAPLSEKTLPYFRVAIRPSWTRRPTQTDADLTTRELQTDLAIGLTQLLATQVGLSAELFYTKLSTHFGDLDGAVVPSGSDFTSDSYGLRFGITAFVF
jgi:hypothetical protein